MNKILFAMLFSNLVENKLIDKKTDLKADSKKNIAQSLKDIKVQLGVDPYSPIKYERPLRKGGSYDIFPYWIDRWGRRTERSK